MSNPSVSTPAQALHALVITDPSSLAPHLQAWDALAVSLGRPFCAPGWMLSWWHGARTGDARLRVVLALDGEELAGVGPFFAQVGRFGLVEMRLLAAGFCHRIGPLAPAGRERAVAVALAGALAQMQPRVASVVFEGIDAADPWPELVASAWPGRRPHMRTDATMDAPAIELDGDYERWLERRPRRFRKEARRTARRLEEEHVTSSISSEQPAIDTLLRLHHERWQGRGGSNVGAAAGRVIGDAMSELGADRRLSVALLEGPEGPVAAELLVRAGDTAAFWGGGFDPRWASFAPGTQAMLLALRALAEQGVRLADLGGGQHEYKLRLADGNHPLVWRTLFPSGARYPLIRIRLAPKHARFAARTLTRGLPPALREPLRRLASVGKRRR